MQLQREETGQGMGPLTLSLLCPRTFHRFQVSTHKGSRDTGRMENSKGPSVSSYPQERGCPLPTQPFTTGKISRQVSGLQDQMLGVNSPAQSPGWEARLLTQFLSQFLPRMKAGAFWGVILFPPHLSAHGGGPIRTPSPS